MKKKFLLLILIFSMISMSGCWDYMEYENMVQILATGIDYNKETNEITVTQQYSSSTQKSKGAGSDTSSAASKSEAITYSATDKTFYGAVAKAQESINKKMFYGYLRTFVIGKNAAKYIMKDIIELHDRVPSLRPTAKIVICSGKASDLLNTSNPYNTKASANQISDLVETSKITGVGYLVTLEDFAQMLSIGGLEATAPHIISISKSSKKASFGNNTSSDVKLDEPIYGGLKVDGLAAFKEDKLVGWLNEKESLGFSWITNKKINSYKASDDSGKKQVKEILYFRIGSSKSKIKIKLTNDLPEVHINIKATADLRKYYSDNAPEFISPEVIKGIESKLSESIRSDIMAALKKGQIELKTDIFGFGFALFRKHPKLWQKEYEKKWMDIYPTLPVYVEVDSKVTNTGTNIQKLYVR